MADNQILSDMRLHDKITELRRQRSLHAMDESDYVEEVLKIIRVERQKGVIDGMLQAKSRVLRRTGIPKDAKNPTRDVVVIIGEKCADIIQSDIDLLRSDEKRELLCELCYREYPVWYAPSELWNAVMRHPDGKEASEKHNFICMDCFAIQAGQIGIKAIWLLDRKEGTQ